MDGLTVRNSGKRAKRRGRTSIHSFIHPSIRPIPFRIPRGEEGFGYPRTDGHTRVSACIVYTACCLVCGLQSLLIVVTYFREKSNLHALHKLFLPLSLSLSIITFLVKVFREIGGFFRHLILHLVLASSIPFVSTLPNTRMTRITPTDFRPFSNLSPLTLAPP